MNKPVKGGVYIPCPMYAEDEEGNRWYCEVGPKAHEGTHVGERSYDEYLLALRVGVNQDGRIRL